jgi:predicted phosphodiesterase
MQVAIISDVHGNLPALEAVLEDVGRSDPEEVWCLGDVVGYGADPDACASLLADYVELCLAGNHDLVVRGDLSISHFTRDARIAARWTADTISPQTLEFLKDLQPLDRSHAVDLYHGSPRDPVWEYVLSTDQARDCLDAQDKRVCMIGHSHVACYFSRNGTRTQGVLATADTQLDLAEGDWLINPGSVGQPRDGDPRAAYLVLDTERWSATYRRVEYAVDRAADAIIKAGLPRQLAERLYVGQ